MQPQSLSEFKFKNNPFLIIAIGTTLAFLPSIVGLITLIAYDYYDSDDFILPFLVQAVGAAIMIVGYSMAYVHVKQLKIKRTGFLLGIIASSIGFVANLLFGIINASDVMRLNIEGIYFGTLLLVIGFLSISPILAISSFKLSKYFTKFHAFGICMWIVAGVIFASYLIWFVFGKYKKQSSLENVNLRGFFEVEIRDYDPSNDFLKGVEINFYSYHDYIKYGYSDICSSYRYVNYRIYEYERDLVDEGLGLITWIAMGASLLSALSAAWMLPKARLKSEKSIGMVEGDNNVAKVEVTAAKDEHSRYMPKESGVVQQPQTSGLSDEVVTLLMGYDNDRLKDIIENPQRYNPAVVAKASMLLCRRLAWEQIKDLTDKELLDMAMSVKGLYDDNIVEAASMELYQRQSALLREQFMLMSPDAVSAIAVGAAPAPEGIRLAAQGFVAVNR